MKAIPPLVRIVLAVALLAFGVLGATNSAHLAAKLVYAGLIAIAAAFLGLQARRADR